LEIQKHSAFCFIESTVADHPMGLWDAFNLEKTARPRTHKVVGNHHMRLNRFSLVLIIFNESVNKVLRGLNKF